MANILGLQTVNGKLILDVDAIPSSGAGTAAAIGSIAMFESAGVGYSYVKIGAANTAWDEIATAASVATLASALVIDSIADADTTHAPSRNAVFDALELKANLASPTFTGTVSGISATMVGLGNVDNTSDTAKPISTATQTALDLKAPLASPAFTGTVSGISATMVGLGNVDNTSDTAKPISTATQTALDLKAALASPTFTGIVITPALTVSGFATAGFVKNAAGGALSSVASLDLATDFGSSILPLANGGTGSASIFAATNIWTGATNTFSNDVIVGGSLTINGSLVYLNATNLQITDRLITLNKGGTSASGAGSGFEIEEDAAISGYFKVSADRFGYDMLAPASAFKVDLDLSRLTAARVQKFSDYTGTFVMRDPAANPLDGRLAFFGDSTVDYNLKSDSRMFFSADTLTSPLMSVGASSVAGVVTVNNAGNIDSTSCTLSSGQLFFDGMNKAGTDKSVSILRARFYGDSTHGQFIHKVIAKYTTDATPLVVDLGLLSGDSMIVRVTLHGHRVSGGVAGDGYSYIRTMRIANNTVKTIQSDYTSESNTSGDVSFSIASSILQATVTGQAATAIQWYFSTEVLSGHAQFI